MRKRQKALCIYTYVYICDIYVRIHIFVYVKIHFHIRTHKHVNEQMDVIYKESLCTSFVEGIVRGRVRGKGCDIPRFAVYIVYICIDTHMTPTHTHVHKCT